MIVPAKVVSVVNELLYLISEKIVSSCSAKVLLGFCFGFTGPA